jgi:type I restriction enzyme M protein
LPSGVFQPYSGVKTSILLFDKETAKTTKNVLFVKIQHDGFDLGAQRREIDKNDLPLALQIIRKFKSTLSDTEFSEDEKQLAHVVAKEKIIESGDYNLSGERYKEVVSFVNQKWPMVELGELEKQEQIKFLRGQGISKKDIVEGGKNKCIHYGEIYTAYQPVIQEVVSKTNIEGKILSEKGDVLVPSTTTADAMGIAVARALNEDDVIIGGDINIIRTNNKYVLSVYLAYLISNSSVKNQLATYAKGVNILHLSNSDLRKLKIPLPPLEVQKEIVEQIEVKQKAIDHAKAIIESLEKERRYFGQVLKNLEGVEWVELGEVVEIQRGGSPRPIDDYITTDNDGINWIKIGDVREGDKFITQTKEKIRKEGLSKTRLVKNGDLILSNSMSFGRPYIVKIDGAIHDGWLQIRIKDKEQITPDFLCQILKTDFLKNQYEKVATGGVVKNLNSNLVKNLKIPLPPLEVQKQLVAEAEKEEEIIAANRRLIEIMERKIKEVLSNI